MILPFLNYVSRLLRVFACLWEKASLFFSFVPSVLEHKDERYWHLHLDLSTYSYWYKSSVVYRIPTYAIIIFPSLPLRVNICSYPVITVLIFLQLLFPWRAIQMRQTQSFTFLQFLNSFQAFIRVKWIPRAPTSIHLNEKLDPFSCACACEQMEWGGNPTCSQAQTQQQQIEFAVQEVGVSVLRQQPQPHCIECGSRRICINTKGPLTSSQALRSLVAFPNCDGEPLFTHFTLIHLCDFLTFKIFCLYPLSRINVSLWKHQTQEQK